MGGKSKPVATNNAMVQMQMQAAADAKQKEIVRKANLDQGTARINALFQGTGGTGGNPLTALGSMGDVPYDPFRVNGSIWNEKTQTWDRDTERDLGNGFTWGKAQPAAQTSGQNQYYAIYGSDGNVVAQAPTLAELSKMTVPGMPGSGTDPNAAPTGGFGPEFYDKYRQAQLDYYLPQEADQYQNARTNLNYSLARAGQLDSSSAGLNLGKLAKQDVMNTAQMASQADNATANLRTQIQQEQEQALNQLYTTEDPSIAANTATNMVANAQLQKPVLNPAGALFAPIAVGVGNALAGYINNSAYMGQSPSAMSTGAGGGGVVADTSSGGTDSSGIKRAA